MAPESQQYTAFTVGNLGFYEFTRMPFGLCNVPATFQRLMQNTLGELNLTYCIIYLDDVIVYGRTEEEHLEHLHIVLERFREFNLKLKPSKCSFFQSEIVYLMHHITKEGIRPSDENIRAILEFPMPETYTEVRAFCGLSGHYRRFIRNFTHLARVLYDLLGDEIKMGPVTLTPEAEEAVRVLKEKIMTAPVLVFPDFNKPFLLETDASKQGLGAVLSQKQDDGRYHPIAFGSRTLTPSEQNYHSSKLEFLALKWSVTEHFKEYLAYAPFTVRTDNNPLTYVLMTPNLDATGHRWVGALASYEFSLEYQKGSDNVAADALSRVRIRHDRKTVRSLLEGAVTGITERGEVLISQPLRAECDRLDNEAQVCALRLASMHITNWEEAQREEALLAACCQWLGTKWNVIPQKRDALLKECMGKHSNSEEGKALFCARNNLTMRKGLMYVNTMPKGEIKGLLAFVVPSAHRRAALNGVHRDAGHQGQQRTLALVEEHFSWPKMVEDCRTLVKGCQCCQIFEGAVVKAPLYPIKAYAPLELVHVDFTSIETTMELNQLPSIKNVLVITDHFTRYS